MVLLHFYDTSMNSIELKEQLDLLGVNEVRYSLNGELNIDSIILFNIYNEWQVFYLDERGGRNDKRVFQTEKEARLFVLNLFIEAKKTCYRSQTFSCF